MQGQRAAARLGGDRHAQAERRCRDRVPAPPYRRRAPCARAAPALPARRRTSSSVARTLRPRRTTSAASAAGSAAPSSARAWPALSAPSSSWRRTGAGKREQPHRVGDMAAALADRLGDARLGAAEFPHQPAIGLGLFERRQILALQIFDERDLQRLDIGELADDDRHLVQPDALRRAPAALAGDQLECAAASRRPAAPAAAAGCPSRGSIAPAPRVRLR